MKNLVFDRKGTLRGNSLSGTVLVLGVLALAWIAVSPTVLAGEAVEFTIAIVRDGPPPGPENDLAALVERELGGHLPGHISARFKRDPAFDAGWHLGHAATALEAALADQRKCLLDVSDFCVTGLATYTIG